MYVPQNLLRSTIPSEPLVEKQENKVLPFLTLMTPTRHAAVRASLITDEVVPDALSPLVPTRALKTLPKQTERGRVKTKKSRQRKKIKKGCKRLKLCGATLYGYQLLVDVRYRAEQYAEARILDLDPATKLLLVHYIGWNARYDAWVGIEVVAAHGSHCQGVVTKDASWNGMTSLFATNKEIGAQRECGFAIVKDTPRKRLAMSPALTSGTGHREKIAAENDTQLVVHQAEENCCNYTQEAETPTLAERTPRRVQVEVETTDEDSERKKDSKTADLVLDVKIATMSEVLNEKGDDHSAPVEFQTETSQRRLESASRGGWKRKRATRAEAKTTNCLIPQRVRSKQAIGINSAKQWPLQRDEVGSSMREKLAAIFRLRVQQRQQMGQLHATSRKQWSLLDSGTKPGGSPTNDGETRGQRVVAGTEECQRQLEQDYYQPQVLFMNKMNTVSEDPSDWPLQEDIMDPRIIQQRLRTLEERCRQQAHVQASYRQLMLTQERNGRALASNEAFTTTKAGVDGTSSAMSWNDATGAKKSTSDKRDAGLHIYVGDDNEITKDSETTLAATEVSRDVIKVVTPEPVEKQHGSSSHKIELGKSNPPSQGVLYEFVL
ncbi:hypothetical protein CCR75_009418 [Bremia lactucae]|uniref:Tudor-knot domain-containing protein n=1 Tax=Bremia lactucae TaxID=4779 RepID=A0A976FGP4_BRELC|nr:hypothetical protein CCR75_009418 [Bremia lactucae]